MKFMVPTCVAFGITTFFWRDDGRSPGVAKKDNSVSSSLEKMIVYVSQRKKKLRKCVSWTKSDTRESYVSL